MLRTTQDLHDYAIGAADGPIGHVVDLFVDDRTWTVRYLVVETGSWLSSRRVLISPMAVGVPDRGARTLPVGITRERVRDAPDVDTDMPVTRRHEIELFGHYGFPDYWSGGGLWGAGMYPDTLGVEPVPYFPDALRERGGAPDERTADADPRLRSCRELVRYRIHASDGEIGRVSDFLVEDRSWAVRYLVVETGHWWHGEQVVIPSDWVRDVTWEEREVRVERSRLDVRDAPPHDSAAGIDEAAERELAEHFARPAA